jgi:hypothetical protein
MSKRGLSMEEKKTRSTYSFISAVRGKQELTWNTYTVLEIFHESVSYVHQKLAQADGNTGGVLQFQGHGEECA